MDRVVKSGRFSKTKDEIVLEKTFCEFLWTKIGDTIRIDISPQLVAGHVKTKEGNQLETANG